MQDLPKRIRAERKLRGLTQGEAATLIGCDQSTVAKWESGKQAPRGEHLAGLARFLRVSLDELVGADVLKMTPMRDVTVIGSVQAGVWSEELEWPHDDQYTVTVRPHPIYHRFPSFGLEVRGTSMNARYPEGTVIVCVSFGDLGRTPINGERVIVRRWRQDGLIEVTIKEYLQDEDGKVWLWPRSKDPRYQQPLELTAPDKDSGAERLQIVGLVILSHQIE